MRPSPGEFSKAPLEEVRGAMRDVMTDATTDATIGVGMTGETRGVIAHQGVNQGAMTGIVTVTMIVVDRFINRPST